MKETNNTYWAVCTKCKGSGRKRKKISKKKKSNFQKENSNKNKSISSKKEYITCKNCKGSGLITSDKKQLPNSEKFPHVAIIGGGIGGVALAIACLHRQIPFTLYERDKNFETRSQGYGLTLQQASKAMAGLGIKFLEKGITSTRHVVHTTEGEIIGEWGIRKWGRSEIKASPKRKNIHIARQSLRLELLKQLEGFEVVKWNHKLIKFKEKKENIELEFEVNNKMIKTKADLLIGADGIRSTVRKLFLGGNEKPLQYLGCIVILGICSLEKLQNIQSDLLDAETVFQTANGNERMYMMPFDTESIMWQFSFPVSEKTAKKWNKKGAKALKEEVIKRTNWHTPIPQIIAATDASQITGYPVYDRGLLHENDLKKGNKITLIGDAAHPMSPFKGQGANQALLDALSLAREIVKECNASSNWREIGLRETVLNNFETEMTTRTSSKVKSSAEAAKLLHSTIVLEKGNGPRGKYRDK